MLRFLGRGSAFTAHHNCALFEINGGAVLLDCPMSAFQRLMQLAPGKPWNALTVLVTHTHGDHAGGIGMLIHFAKHVLHIPVTVIAPSAEVADDLRVLLERLDGCSPDVYTLQTADTAPDWLKAAVPVRHSEALAGRCFGYVLHIQGCDVVYTGDTAELAPFLPYLHAGAYLYTEASAYDTGVHLYIDAILPELKRLSAESVHIFLMHLDAEDVIADKIRGMNVQLAPLFGENA